MKKKPKETNKKKQKQKPFQTGRIIWAKATNKEKQRERSWLVRVCNRVGRIWGGVGFK